MDTLTHGLVGSVLTRSTTDRPGARAALLTGLIAAMLPDLDVLFLPTRLAYLRDHRGWTHSFLVLPVFALGVALLARLIFRRARFVSLWLFAAVGIASHIVFDWITSFGTMFFYPLSRRRYSLDWVFIVDPVVFGVALATLLATVAFRARGRRIAVTGTAILAGYLALCAALHARALAEWRRRDRPPETARVAALPQLLSPFRWLGLTELQDSVHAGFFDIGPFARGVEKPLPPKTLSEILRSLSDFYPAPARMAIAHYALPPDSRALEIARELPGVQVYLQFARFPRATVRPTPGGGTEVIWEDLRFLPWFAGPWSMDRNRTLRRRPFLYRVRLDVAGRPLESDVVDTLSPP
jgi:inner membrane protein